MITKDELERLKQPSNKNAEMRYTIGGPLEAAVHSNVEAERIGKLQRGLHAMHKAVAEFRNEMTFKTREGQARAQFLNNNVPPPQDLAIAQNTWQQNHMQAHEAGFNRASNMLKQDTKKAFNANMQTSKLSEPVKEFAASMQARSQSTERSRS